MDISDVRHLANLSRLALTDEELAAYAKDMDSILGYVEQIKGAVGDVGHSTEGDSFVENVMRDDSVTNEKGEYTEALLKAAPTTRGDRVEVKKILATGDEQ